MTTSEAHTFRPRIYGSYITFKVRQLYRDRDLEALAQLCPTMSLSDAVAVGKGEKTIEGNNEDGFEILHEDGFEETPEPTWKDEG